MENQFELVSEYKPSGDQPEAIRELVSGLKEDKKFQVLLGATGTGKTFTISNVIAQVNRPTLVFAHNKTLAGQLYSEFKEFFPHNRVEYFVSYFDYYQPEAYLPKTCHLITLLFEKPIAFKIAIWLLSSARNDRSIRIHTSSTTMSVIPSKRYCTDSIVDAAPIQSSQYSAAFITLSLSKSCFILSLRISTSFADG